MEVLYWEQLQLLYQNCPNVTRDENNLFFERAD